MLDDLKFIHQRDGQDALGIAERQCKQLEHTFEVKGDRLQVTDGIENIVFAGMGGSALAALFSQSWPGYSIPFEICRQYHIPKYVSGKTLFIASSYSGNTEETLSALDEAEAKGAKIAAIASGGKLIEIAKAKSYPYLVLPQDAGNPRYAVLYSYKALLTILTTAGLTDQSKLDELSGSAQFLKNTIAGWLPTVPTDKNPAKKLAEELAGKAVAIYAGPLMSPAAYKWKISFNENAKNLAWWNQLPEFDHNELSGWLSNPVQKLYAVVDLRSSLEHERVQKRFNLTDRLLSGKRPAANVVQAQGDSLLQQLLWTVVYGDFTSLYLALLNNVNPSPVDAQEKFKLELG